MSAEPGDSPRARAGSVVGGHIAEACERAGDEKAARRWRERADDWLADAPEAVLEKYGWLDG